MIKKKRNNFYKRMIIKKTWFSTTIEIDSDEIEGMITHCPAWLRDEFVLAMARLFKSLK